MGYEIKMMIGRKSGISTDGQTWFSVYAEIDLCKIGYDSSLSSFIANEFKKAKQSNESVYIYGLDGNITFTEDRYGDKLPICDIKQVYKEMLKAKKEDVYRRFVWACALLKSMKDDSEGLQVLFFGH